MAEHELHNNPEQKISAELAQRVYTKAEELRLYALASVGLDTENLARGVRHLVTLRNPSSRLRIYLTTESKTEQDDNTLRLIEIKHIPYQGEEFDRGRYVEPDGTMWQMGDSSQGQPWHKAELPSTDLVEMLSCLEEIESNDYQAEVRLVRYL